VVLARLGNVYGPYSHPSTQTAFTDLVAQARAARRIRLAGPPGSLRNHVHAADAADGLLRALCLGAHGQCYNIGSEDHLSNLELARAVAAACPFPVDVEATNPAPPDHMVLSIARARGELFYSPRHPACDHLGASVRWLLEQSP
jgi:nucleoside-diphosphate-sugar epimerase